jgi:glyoxylase-like metal-dependent hydrolase (beta-lactamase superfamily II)
MTHALTVGGIRVLALPDGHADLPSWPVPAESLAEAPIAWAEHRERTPHGFHGEHHHWRIHNTCYALETEGARILVDCGVGVGPYPRYGNMRGELLEVLPRHGLSPEDFDIAFLTHAHPDHVGWAYDEERQRPRFPKARYLLHRRDWEHFGGRETVPPYFRRFLQPLADAGVLDFLEGETEIAPGATALHSPGHTPGHMSLLVQSRGEGLVIAGDVLNSPVYVTEPERPFSSDADIPLGIRTRTALLGRAEAEGWRVAAEHFPEPGWGDLVRIDGRRWFRAL